MVMLPFYVNWQIKKGIREQVVMESPESHGYSQFLDRNVQGETTMEYYMFNITNPDEVLAGKEKPRLEELGPFIYNQRQVRADVKWFEKGDALSYRQHVYQIYNRSRTFAATRGRFGRGDFDDPRRVMITNVNLLFSGVRAQAGDTFWHVICDHFMWKSDFKRLFAVKSVHDWVFGYREPLDLGFGVTIPIPFPGLVPNHTRPEVCFLSWWRRGAD